MILKDKIASEVQGAAAKAGQRQEQDVAFFLRRSFKDDDKVFVFNDLKFEHNDETAQIDHLVLYPYGFVLIESKSITGEITVNSEHEWSRSYNGQWKGMASPIKQVELQQNLLRELLFNHRDKILGKMLMIQQGFGGRCWDNLCAVSSNAIIHREKMPKDVSEQLVKSEFLPDKLKKVMRVKSGLTKAISILDSRPAFSMEEMESIAKFLIEKDISSNTESFSAKPSTENIAVDSKRQEPVVKDQIEPTGHLNQDREGVATKIHSCSKCGGTDKLQPSNGKYGYYFKCLACSGNTAMKRPCAGCGSKQTKVSKSKETYSIICQECDFSAVLWSL